MEARERAERQLAELEVREPARGETGMAWLRSSVARFANGEAHRRRRALAEGELARLDPQALALEAAAATRAALADSRELDAMPLARAATVHALLTGLAGRLPATALVADAVRVAAAYPPGSPSGAAEDEALGRLVAELGDGEPGAARVALLAQACEATAALVGNALLGEPRGAVRLTRRVGPAGEDVVVDLDAAGLPFGAGPHACPGRRHAEAIAAAVVTAILDTAEVVEDAPAYERSPNLRLPARVRIRIR